MRVLKIQLNSTLMRDSGNSAMSLLVNLNIGGRAIAIFQATL